MEPLFLEPSALLCSDLSWFVFLGGTQLPFCDHHESSSSLHGVRSLLFWVSVSVLVGYSHIMGKYIFLELLESEYMGGKLTLQCLKTVFTQLFFLWAWNVRLILSGLISPNNRNNPSHKLLECDYDIFLTGVTVPRP